MTAARNPAFNRELTAALTSCTRSSPAGDPGGRPVGDERWPRSEMAGAFGTQIGTQHLSTVRDKAGLLTFPKSPKPRKTSLSDTIRDRLGRPNALYKTGTQDGRKHFAVEHDISQFRRDRTAAAHKLPTVRFPTRVVHSTRRSSQYREWRNFSAPLCSAYHHVDLPAATPAAHKPRLPFRDRHLGAVALSQLCRVWLDLMPAIEAPHEQPQRAAAAFPSVIGGPRYGFTVSVALDRASAPCRASAAATVPATASAVRAWPGSP
jgi:hypothetical protein